MDRHNVTFALKNNLDHFENDAVWTGKATERDEMQARSCQDRRYFKFTHSGYKNIHPSSPVSNTELILGALWQAVRAWRKVLTFLLLGFCCNIRRFM
jgi:hypothetical protein